MTPARPTLHPSRRTVLRGLAAGMAAAALPGWAGTARSAAGELSVAVVPQFPAAETHRQWSPLLERLGRDTGLALKLKLQASIPKFEIELLAGLHDIVFMNPYHLLMALGSQAYLPLVRNAKPLTGILVVRRESPARQVQDLHGQRLAFPAPNAFGASLWMRALLSEHEHLAFETLYAQTHSNVYRHVIRGEAAAGGGVNTTFAQEREEVRADLRVIYETPGAASHPLCAHPRVPASVRAALTDALLALAKDADGRLLLEQVFPALPVRADLARDYRPLENFKLGKYMVPPSP